VAAPETRPMADGMQVLVVDDDSALIRTLSDILRLNGYDPLVAATAKEGLDIAGRSLPALAVVDLRLPDMDGMELVARLHELSALTEVVVLTGNASVESAIAALRENSIDYLIKPVQVEKLLHVATLATERWQRRNAEAKLRESDDRFRRVVESDMLGILFWDDEGMVYDANSTALGLLQYTDADIAEGRLRRDALSAPGHATTDAAMMEELRRDGIAPPHEAEFVRRDGVSVPVLVGASALSGARGGGVAFVLDITVRKRAEVALVARARQQAAVAALGQRAVSGDDLSALFDAATESVAETLGVPYVSVLELGPRGAALVLRAGEGWPPEALGFKLELAKEDTQSGFTLRNNSATILADLATELRFEGARVLREFGIQSGVTVPIPGSAGRAYGVLAAHETRVREFSVDDLHFLQAVAHILGAAIARLRSEATSRQAQRLEAVGRLAGGIAHDFNNILAAIIGYSEVVQGNLKATDPSQKDLEEILNASQRAAGLTRQLLAFSRQQVLQPRLMNLNDSVRGIEGMVSRLLGKQVDFRVEIADDLAMVRADPSQVEQVILNLCVNARDAMSGGGTLTVSTRNVDATHDGSEPPTAGRSYPQVMLSVTDTGTGMDADTKARIFEPFFSTKSPDQGTGLGLATVYGIVQQSGGELVVDSELGHGSTFKVLLPAAQ
jgi:two-component system cell cycle sensor histidine kinase/response regulator CckA